jgi:serine phosphatase RsbU (regulator of sigma subunit)/ligand-binding sensor domain-containing protein
MNLNFRRTSFHAWLQLLLLLVVCHGQAFSQTGDYYITNFSPADYRSEEQNWCSIQDAYGRIFIADNGGILFNDGNWGLIHMRNESRCFALAIDNTKKIFAGGENEFGYLEVSPRGEFEYHSLSKDLPLQDREFGFVWAIRCINDEVFFCSNEKLFWYKNGKIKSFSPQAEAFHTFFIVGNTLFVREKQVGFKVFINGELKKVEDTEMFANQRVDFILPFKKNMYWVGTRNDGMYLLLYDAEHPNKSIFSKLKSPLDEWMAKNELYCGAKVNDNMYALGSLKGGILLVDKNFKLIRAISEKDGLQDNGVKHIFVDNNENLWLSLALGVSFLESNTPITRWTRSNGIKGAIESSVKFEKKLYIATDKGLQVLDAARNRFTDTDIGDQCFDLLVKNNKLLVGTANALYSLSEGKAKLLLESPVYKIFPDPFDPGILYLGTDKGLTIISVRDSKLIEVKSFNEWGDVRSAARTREGLLCFGTSGNGIFLLDVKDHYRVKRLTEAEGLPSLIENYVFSYSGELMVGTPQGIYKIESGSSPVTCRKLKALDSLSKSLLLNAVTIAKQINNDIWLNGIISIPGIAQSRDDALFSIHPDENGAQVKNRMLNRIRASKALDFFQDGNLVYISTNNGLYCYDVSAVSRQMPFYTFISTLNFINEKKSGRNADSSLTIQNLVLDNNRKEITLPFSSNEVYATPSASDYYDMNELRFASFLEGKEENYGAWTRTPLITYNNLHEGHYVLHLKSRNLLSQEGKEVSVSFLILPPWYRTLWAYLLYLLLTALLIWLIVKLNTKRLQEQNIRLEKIITERTSTIAHQKEEIEDKNREITDSINYAKRIQDAILPSVKEMKKNWADTFVFFQPKDIVSGDFYWFHKISAHEFLVGVADCTGHGVPGGFMSMICSDKLNEAAGISTDPSRVLHYANNAIKSALKQGEDENTAKDGMEIALIRVNTQTREVQFTGANRPLWIIRKESTELEEIKPTKAGVASQTPHDFSYQLHQFALSAGDSLYMTSDGYPDQFGGPKGKKYMTANFKKFIFSIKDKPAQKQNDLVNDNINNWMKGYEQVDDLLVIGIKL